MAKVDEVIHFEQFFNFQQISKKLRKWRQVIGLKVNDTYAIHRTYSNV